MKPFMMRHVKWVRLVAVIAITWYFVSVSLNPYDFSLINTFNLIMHEAGHWIFMLGGQFLGMLGGSLLQVLIPTIFAWYFWRQQQDLGLTFCLLWLGQNLIDISIYVGDAIMMQLPLLGGHSVIHDWNWLLIEMGLLQYTDLLANAFSVLGWTMIITGIIFGFRSSLLPKRKSKPVRVGV